jgi:hypothetical protein
MNPMAKEHLNAVLDALLAIGVEESATHWITHTAQRIGMQDGFTHGIGVADDVAGGWTTRADIDMARRFAPNPAVNTHWCCTTLFASDTHSLTSVAQEVRASVVRRHWHACHGAPQTLRQMLAQEQLVARIATPHALPAELPRSQAVRLEAILDECAYPVLVAAVLGDEAAGSLGYQGQGFLHNAGLAYAANPAYALLMPAEQAQFFPNT